MIVESFILSPAISTSKLVEIVAITGYVSENSKEKIIRSLRLSFPNSGKTFHITGCINHGM